MGAVSRAVAALEQRPRLLRALGIGATLVVLGLCAYSVETQWRRAGPKLRDVDLGYFALALAVVATYYLVFILGWIRILATWDVHVPYRAALQAEMVSMIAKYIPGGVWTPAARVAALARLTGERNTPAILASILVEAVLSAISGIVVFVNSLARGGRVDAPLSRMSLVLLSDCAAL